MDYESTIQRHVEYLMARIPQHLERLRWSASQLRAERISRLRKMVSFAKANSPWHRMRLAEIEVDQLDEESLRELPVMTKDDLMTHFNEIVTDRRIMIDRLNEHVSELTTDAYFLDEYHAVASGGSSGVRGVFVWGW